VGQDREELLTSVKEAKEQAHIKSSLAGPSTTSAWDVIPSLNGEAKTTLFGKYFFMFLNRFYILVSKFKKIKNILF
jgi:hypothetical protein